MTYLEFLDILSSYAETDFALFQKRLIFTKYEIMGVRTPILRKIAKEYGTHYEEVFTFPNEYYEVVFIKLTMVSELLFEEFSKRAEDCVALMDNWALCDSFKAKSIKNHKEEFLPILERIFQKGGEFEQRYPLVTMLFEYMEKRYYPSIENFIIGADCSLYYAHMAVAWLIAELLIKDYEYGISLLKKGLIPIKTNNKAIQKAIESYRLTQHQKEFLRSLKIK